MDTWNSPSGERSRTAGSDRQGSFGSLFFLAFCIGITFISVGITAVLAIVLGPKLQAEMGPIGQIYESVDAAFSGLGFIALVVTFRLQYDELRMQRRELKNQHTAMSESQGHLGRSAECDVRARHVELMRMAMDDPDLAECWPEFQVGLSPNSPARSCAITGPPA